MQLKVSIFNGDLPTVLALNCQTIIELQARNKNNDKWSTVPSTNKSLISDAAMVVPR